MIGKARRLKLRRAIDRKELIRRGNDEQMSITGRHLEGVR